MKKIFFAILMIVLLVPLRNNYANPNFSRKYKLNCNVCHTAPPQLSRVGIEFRRLGYRFPNELRKVNEGKSSKEPEKLSPEMFSKMDKIGCTVCHSVEKGKPGVSLLGVGSKRSEADIKAYVISDTHPGADVGKSLSTEDLNDISKALEELKTPVTQNILQQVTDIGNYISMRNRTQFRVTKRSDQSIIKNQFFFRDMTFYYMGPVSRYLTIFTELEIGEGFETDLLAQGTLLWGNPDNVYAYLKIGHMRLVRQEIGALDRPKTLSTDLAVSSSANKFKLNTDQVGMEMSVGFNKNKSLLRVFVTNGIDSNGSGRRLDPQDLNPQKDVCIMFENFFGTKTNTSLAGVFYHGQTPYNPVPGQNIQVDRFGIFGTLALNNKKNFEDIRLNAGYLYGLDAVPGVDEKDKSTGFLVGLDKRLGDMFYISTRFDYFRPTQKKGDNITRSVTVGLMNQIFQNLRISAEYQLFYRPGDVKDNRFTAEFFTFF